MTLFTKECTVAGDAGEQISPSGSVSITSSDLELATESTNPKLIGLRFTNVTIAKNATIDDAFIQFECDEVTEVTQALVTINADDVDDAAIIAAVTDNIADRLPGTTATVDWEIAAWVQTQDRLAAQKTPDIASVIQEIVDRAGWVSGQDIVILIDNNGSTNNAFRTSESDPISSPGTNPPELSVNYTVGGGANPKGPLGHVFQGPLGGPI